MGKVSSVFADVGNYHTVLDSDNNIQILARSEGVTADPIDQNLHLEVRKWRSNAPYFYLGVDKLARDGAFDDDVDYIDDTLHFFFKLPGNYEGGHEGLLRRTRQLLEDTGPHGITNKYVGKEAVKSKLASLIKPSGTNFPWRRPSVDFL